MIFNFLVYLLHMQVKIIKFYIIYDTSYILNKLIKIYLYNLFLYLKIKIKLFFWIKKFRTSIFLFDLISI